MSVTSIDRKTKKAFDNVSHRRLLYKLAYYRVRGHTLQWIESFLGHRKQRVLLDNIGCRSSQVDVITGVPQGPLLFLAFINDLPEAVKHSVTRFFVDDCLLYRLIRSDVDAKRLQEDLEALEKWEKMWQMKLQPEKCQVIRINTNKRFERQSNYKLHRHTLEVVDSGKYLGVNMSIDLIWHTHIDETTAKASNTLGFLRRNLSECTKQVKSAAYTSLVRPTLEYASSVEDITQLEKVQRQAARFPHSNYHDRAPGCVTKMVSDLGWEPLQHRRRVERLSTLYKIQQDLVETDTDDIICPSDKHTRGQQRLYQPATTMPVYKDSFFPWTILDWNTLPTSVTDAATLEEFHASLGLALPALQS